MEMFNAYEVLDELAKKSKMFEMINEDFKMKDEEIKILKSQVNELTIILGDLMLGGM